MQSIILGVYWLCKITCVFLKSTCTWMNSVNCINFFSMDSISGKQAGVWELYSNSTKKTVNALFDIFNGVRYSWEWKYTCMHIFYRINNCVCTLNKDPWAKIITWAMMHLLNNFIGQSNDFTEDFIYITHHGRQRG